jgi:hypothetical protein
MNSNTWKDNLKSYVMRTNFYLGLTRPQMEYLCAVADDVEWDRFRSGPQTPFNFIASEGALEKRGLIERKKGGRGHWRTENVYDITSTCVLTPAGRLVVELLKITGLFIEQDNAIERKAAAKVASIRRKR